MIMSDDLDLVVEIVDGVKNRVGVVDIHDLAVGKDAMHGFLKDAPFRGAVKIVGHEKTAVQAIVAKFGGLTVGNAPFADLHSVEPGPVVNFVAIVEIDDLFDRPDMHARQAAQGQREVAVGGREILAPEGNPGVPIVDRDPRNRCSSLGGYIRRAKANSVFS